MFMLNERVFYPGYGIAKISNLIMKNVNGVDIKFYELEFFRHKEARALMPEERLKSVGIRKISSLEDLANLFENIFKKNDKDFCNISNTNWSKKFKRYKELLRSGDIAIVFFIYRDFYIDSKIKKQSFGEKNLFLDFENVLVEEISVVKNLNIENSRKYLRDFFEENIEALLKTNKQISK